MTQRSPLDSIHPRFARFALYAWGTVGIAAVGLGALWLLGQLWVVVLTLVIAILLTRVLEPVAVKVRPRLGRTFAAVVTLVGFLVVMAVAVTAIGAAVGTQMGQLDVTVTKAVDDIERWLVEDAPVDVSRDDINEARDNAGEAVRGWFRSSSDSVVAGVVLAGEMLVGILLGLVVTFFLLKDGNRFATWVHGKVPAHRRDVSARMGRRAWDTIGGYLKGAAALGVIEGVAAGLTLTIVGGQLAVPIAVITFLLAFIPFVGAVVAGLLAVLVALATAGPTAALIVAVVMLVVQQLDNDLLAPVVYGHQLAVHPVGILLSIIAGGALFGLAGTVLAVPVTAVVVNLVAEYRSTTASAT